MVDITELPEGCITHILSLTSPSDACKSMAVSLTFQSAAQSDALWERFLPSNYEDIISKSVDPLVFTTKKDLYFRLCQSPILLDGGTKSFALDKKSGKICYMLGARELSIAWGDNPSYWNWISLPESRFSEVAQLQSVCWLEIKGRMKTKLMSPNTTYAVYFVFKVDESFHGFENLQIKVSVKVVETEDLLEHGGENDRTIYLFTPPTREGSRAWWETDIPEDGVDLPRKRVDGWNEIQIGEFLNDDTDEHSEVGIRLREIQQNHWKHGLIVQGFELRPKDETWVQLPLAEFRSFRVRE